MNQENKEEKWEIKIDEWLKADYQVSPDFRESLKTIIRCLLRAQKEEIERQQAINLNKEVIAELKANKDSKEMQEIFDEAWKVRGQKLKEEILKEIERMKKKIDTALYADVENRIMSAINNKSKLIYNQALQDLINKIKEIQMDFYKSNNSLIRIQKTYTEIQNL